ncbi:type II secretion system F family protein [Kribbella sp. VKM Ac-2568]|uniref:type II secretion system F family protein n=1 Tax=Kribbella sp. VKM Ac-2568 TaxID=2512219 RepID=UPI0010CF80E6|nr:type II secretion system F family protein [Kribbella sp. VKM Ac-2568]TCM49120.1 type II secretion system (T2SS) protein F [Kribbella sp. VKM Ac-2568]
MREPSLLMPALAAAVAVAFLLPGRPGPRRLGRRRTVLSDWQLPGLLKAKQVPPKTRRMHRAAATAASAGLLLLLGIPWGMLLAPVAFVGIPIALSRLEPAAARQRTARIVAELPLAVDLLAACLRAGRPPQAAIGIVGTALGGPLANLFNEVEHHLNLGADPIDAWSCLIAEPACATFARTTQRALRSGAPLAKTLERQADDTRQARRWSAEEQARAVESRSVVPLGLCFLPAFVVLGIVPTIAGSLAGILDLFA